MQSGCEGLALHDMSSLLLQRFQRSEVLGFVAGLGTTFAAVPDLIKMLRRRSSQGMNPTRAAIMGVFQIVWVYYGLLILARPVIAWNVVAVSKAPARVAHDSDDDPHVLKETLEAPACLWRSGRRHGVRAGALLARAPVLGPSGRTPGLRE
jgi:uncharacterized protein with PQ loop repeat